MTLYGKGDIKDMIKELEMGILSWIIQMDQMYRSDLIREGEEHSRY